MISVPVSSLRIRFYFSLIECAGSSTHSLSILISRHMTDPFELRAPFPITTPLSSVVPRSIYPPASHLASPHGAMLCGIRFQ